MPMLRLLVISAPLLMIAISAQSEAQDWASMGTKEPFVGSGTARITRPADRMLATIPIRASGSDIREATKALQAKIEAAKAKLEELGVEDETVVASAFSINNETADTSRRMMRGMMESRLQGLTGSRESENPEEATAPVVTVASKLTGEWKLAGIDGPDLLASSWELQESIRAAKLSEDDTAEELSPEEQEMLEEARCFGSSSDDASSTEPVFVFLGTVTSEERESLLKEAYKKAEAEARELASTTGLSLGPLGSVRTSGSFSEQDPDYGMPNYQLFARMSAELTSRNNPLEMIGASPSELTYSVQITAGFQIGP